MENSAKSAAHSNFEIRVSPVPLAIPGVRLSTAAAGIKYADRDDVALIELSPGAICAGSFTQNKFCAAPVVVARDNLKHGAPRYLLYNSGNANAGTGAAGLADVKEITQHLAALGDVEPWQVLPFSTGVIGERLEVSKFSAVFPALLGELDEENWADASRAIMTTDVVPKQYSIEVKFDDVSYQFSGIAKGAGMIHPNMATMLAFIATDAPLEQTALTSTFQHCVDKSFNRITVDGDTSTNDACVIAASGRGPSIGPAHPHWQGIEAAMEQICSHLAQALVRDGEGATKFVEIVVSSASESDGLAIANTVALSPLVKTAIFAEDPNWGRILAAVGRAPVEHLDLSKVDIFLNEHPIVECGERSANYVESIAAQLMKEKDIVIRIHCGSDDHVTTMWTCDFSYDYVRINAEYRS